MFALNRRVVTSHQKSVAAEDLLRQRLLATADRRETSCVAESSPAIW